MPTPLPSGANLDHLKKQAKTLLKVGRKANQDVAKRFQAHHPNYASGVAEPQNLKLQEAQLVIAREYGFASWAQLTEAITEAQNNHTPDQSGILLITNGMSAVEALNKADLPGQKEEWLEALHDGPVPLTETRRELNRIRAKHIASLGWSSEEGAYNRFQKRDALLKQPNKHQELQLWFEHDLYDQLQLIQILDTLSDHPQWIGKTYLVQTDNFLTELSPDKLAATAKQKVLINRQHIQGAQYAWKAFRADGTQLLKDFMNEDLNELPLLKSAITRLLQEHPASDNGLGRTERQILEAVAAGADKVGPIFQHSQKAEEARFMGDLSFYQIVDRLTQGNNPPLAVDGSPHLFDEADASNFSNRRLQLTDTGSAILTGRIRYQTPPYWLGGTQIGNQKT